MSHPAQWIETAGGQLVNLAHVQHISTYATRSTVRVVAYGPPNASDLNGSSWLLAEYTTQSLADDRVRIIGGLIDRDRAMIWR